MPNLRAFTSEFCQRLHRSVAANVGRYKAATPWVPLWAASSSWEFDTPCPIAGSLELLLPHDDDYHDLPNAIRLHKALSSLTRLQASDPRLWTHLTHVELWEYMRARWPIERYLADPEKAVGRVHEQYFVPQRQSRALVRNGAARLWWAAKMTYDPTRQNPYELTAVLLSSLDIAKNLLERNFGRIPTLTNTFLDYLLLHKEECLHSGNASRLMVRHLTKTLNLHGGICLLDCMSPAHIVAVLDKERIKVLANAYTDVDDDQDEG